MPLPPSGRGLSDSGVATAGDLRFNWNSAIAVDPFDPNAVYFGSQRIHKSTNRGDSWTAISPDLTEATDREGLTLIVAGVSAGLLAAALASRALQHLLHGVAPLDPLTFAAGGAVATVLSLAACYGPARRAASISPAELLREA